MGGAGGVGNASAGGSGNEGGTGDGGAPPGRGNPDDFPTECTETCEEACQAVVDCGSESSPTFPIDLELCLAQCNYQLNRNSGDISQNFRCCASQQQCGAVAHCGGWLNHPLAQQACETQCGCFNVASLDSLHSGYQAPPGYRFAPDLVMVEPHDPGDRFDDVAGVQTTMRGSRRLVRVEAGPSTALAQLAARGTLLPTFVDARGRVSSATGRIVVKTASESARLRADGLAAQFGMARVRKLKHGELYIYEASDAIRTLDALSPLNAEPGVRAEIDMRRQYQLRFTPNDPLFPDQWHLESTGQRDSTPGIDVRATEAWDLTTGDPEVIIAINDDGVDLDHPDFAGRLEPELNFPADWQLQLANGSFGRHGTSVAGVAAASGDNALGGSGACPECRILPHLLAPVAQNGSFDLDDIDQAEGFVNQVDAGAWIISNSWGLESGDPQYVDPSFPNLPPLAMVVSDAYDYAETTGRGGLGTVILFAAGNSNDEIDSDSGYATNIAVGAIDNLGLKSWYSALGPELDIGAPSSGGLAGITTAAAGGQSTDDFGGTSSACPLAAGVVGLIMSADKTLTAAEVRDLVKATASPIDPLFGEWDVDGHSNFYGAGMINAYTSVAVASGVCADAASCVAPSDVCGVGECDRGMCETCRSTNDCAADHICQALPTLGLMTCIPIKDANPCPSGSTELNGYCVPFRTTCNLCQASEECNGRDDDCNGEIDDGVCGNSGASCWIDGPGCPAGMACAGNTCVTSCTTAADCSTGQTCRVLKNQMGASGSESGCISSFGGGGNCELRCPARASAADDETLAEWATCIEEGGCDAIRDCRDLLP